MKQVALIIAVPLVILGGVLLFYLSRAEPVAPVQPVAQTADASDELRDALADANAQLSEDLAAAEARIAELEAANEEMESAAPVEVDEPEPMPEPEEEAADEETDPTIDTIREAIQNNAAAMAQLQGLSEIVYSDFINALDVDAATKAQVRELLKETYMENVVLSRYAMNKGDVPWSTVRGWQLDERAVVSEQLRSVLPDDAYRTWEAYAADVEARELDGMLRQQINAFSSGLTPENSAMVTNVAVEEFRAEQMALEQSDVPYTMAENVRYQLRAMDAMRARLSEVMAEDQYAEVENFLTMGERVLSAQLPNESNAEQ